MTSKAKTAGSVADKLREAKALVAKGWTRGEYCRDGRVCSYGALYQAFTGDPEGLNMDLLGGEFFEARRCLFQVIGRNNIISWNDEQTSKRPVLTAFDKAIALAEAGQ
jgi:hypothetical protein